MKARKRLKHTVSSLMLKTLIQILNYGACAVTFLIYMFLLLWVYVIGGIIVIWDQIKNEYNRVKRNEC